MHLNSTSEPASPSPAAAASESAALRRWITIGGLLLIVLIVAADAYEGWQDYRAAVSANQRVQVALSRAIAEQTTRLIQEADVVLSGFAVWRISAEGRVADEGALRERLRADIARLPFVHSAAIAGADGHLLATTQNVPIANLSLQKRPAFTVPQQARDNALYISPPFVSTRDGARTFALSRRLQDPSGAFAGVVVARVAFDYLAAFYGAVNVTPDTAINLMRTDGVSLIRYPSGAQPTTVDAYVPRHFGGGSDTTELVRRASVDGHDQFSVLRQVEGYPVVVEVSRPMSGVLQPWIQQELASAARTLTLAILAGLLLVALRAALARHDRMIGEQRQLEKDLAASQRADALGLLAASMAHDFNNVLTAIVGYAELAGQSLAGGPAAGHLTRLLAASERARLLVRRVLTFDPRRSLTYHPLAAGPIVQEALQQLQASLPASVRTQANGLDRRSAILGDDTEVHQIVMNLLSNAIKSMPQGGTVEVRLEPVEVSEPQEQTLGKIYPGSWLRLSIADQGVGMTAQQAKAAFEPFYTTGNSSHSTGIGLTVVRNIILRMNGALAVDSRPGSGSTMSVYWPSVGAPPADARQARTEGRGETILVVDDDAELVTLAEDLLASLGYEPVGFADAQAALVAFRRNPRRFRAVLTDERMSPLRGVEFAALVHEIVPEIPIILMTGHRNTDIEVRAAKAGIAEILDKPLRLQTLQAALDREFSVAIETAGSSSDIGG
jgi:signal transduction histidine kinase/ActR/RegA family two-component response regulator